MELGAGVLASAHQDSADSTPGVRTSKPHVPGCLGHSRHETQLERRQEWLIWRLAHSPGGMGGGDVDLLLLEEFLKNVSLYK